LRSCLDTANSTQAKTVPEMPFSVLEQAKVEGSEEMNDGQLVSIILGALGIAATVGLGLWFYVRTGKVIRRVNAILTARMTPTEYRQALRLVDDIEKTGEKRGTIVQRPNGALAIDWNPGEAVEPKV
jgi:hypothetical protein